MPVLLKSESSIVYPAVDVEALVNEVRERLCLKSREKLCSQRSAPYHIRGSVSSSLEQYNKHYASPEMLYRCKQRPQNSYNACTYRKNMSSKLRDDQTFENPRDLLTKLISEQSLIQEAVRRLQCQTQTTTPVSKKFFSVADDNDDSCDQFSNQTPIYSEPNDDCHCLSFN